MTPPIDEESAALRDAEPPAATARSGASSPAPVRTRAPIPPSSRGRAPLALGVLRPMRFVALLFVLTMLLARALVPALRGVIVGVGPWVDAADLVGGVLTQLLAFGASVLAGAMLVQLSQAGAPRLLRFALVVAGVFVVLATSGSAAVDHPPDLLLVTVALAASLAAVVAGLDALRQPTGGVVGLVWVLTGIASLLRLGGAQLVELAIARVGEPELALRLVGYAGHLATIAFITALLAQLVAMVFIARASGWVVSPQVLVVVAAAVLVARWLSTPPDDHSASWLVTRGVVEALTARPPPAVPIALIWAQAIVGPTLALAALSLRREVPALLGALALVLLVPGTADVPMLGLGLFLGAVTLALVTRDAKGLWATLERRAPSRGGSA